MMHIVRGLIVLCHLTSITVERDAKLLRAFGARIRVLRQRVSLSQEALADKARLDRTYLGGIERGERNPSFQNIARIARALDISISELMQGVEVSDSIRR